MKRMSGLSCIGRRGFIGGLAAATACPAFAEDEKPLFKVGLVTDTHVRKTRESCARVPKGFSDFRYVVEFKRQATATPYDFVMRQGDRMKVLFRKLALDRLG